MSRALEDVIVGILHDQQAGAMRNAADQLIEQVMLPMAENKLPRGKFREGYTAALRDVSKTMRDMADNLGTEHTREAVRETIAEAMAAMETGAEQRFLQS